MADPKIMAANEKVKGTSGLLMNLAGVLIAYTVGDAALNKIQPIMIIWIGVGVVMILASWKVLDLIQAED